MNNFVLVIDDDEGILEVVKIILEDRGYKVETVQDSSMITGVIDKKLPQLILLDIWMSGIDGQEITRTLKKDALTSHIPIILMSANQETEKIAKATGADGFITKPFDIDHLALLVKYYIKK